MKALTLTQPWASLVALGAKQYETRSWFTPYRGPVAIHAARGFPEEARDACWDDDIRAVLEAAQLVDYAAYSDLGATDSERFDGLPRGVILATATLVEVVRTQTIAPSLSVAERAFGDYYEGRWAFKLVDLRPLRTPIPARGALGLWALAAPLRAEIESQSPAPSSAVGHGAIDTTAAPSPQGASGTEA